MPPIKTSSSLLIAHITTYLLRSVIISVCVGCAALSDPLPQGTSGPQAEALTDCMLEAINADAFSLSAGARWSFMGHRYLWRKDQGLVRVILDDDERVYLDVWTGGGRAFEEEEELKGEERDEAIAEALKAFHNDSFWAFAPFKVRDEGTSRALIKRSDLPKQRALLVTYASGGTTPGDSYLWLLDQDCRPYAWQMWVEVLPIGGLEVSWAGWRQAKSGAWLSTEHHLSGLSLTLSDLELTREGAALDEGDPLLTRSP